MKTKSKIEKRDGVNPSEGKRQYGNVEFADPTNKKYPVDTPEHVRAAWAYINQNDNAAKYEADEVAAIKERVRRAAEKQHVAIRED